jgi:anti-anti-sigma factor
MVKLRLVVVTRGRWQGKKIPVSRSPFLIGRDPACQLRPASVVVSNRHCALVLREGKAFVQDLGSRNGTFLNDKPLSGEQQLKHGDALRIGPLDFDIELETVPAIDKATPLPPTKGSEGRVLPVPGLTNGSPAQEQEDVPSGNTELDLQIRYPVEWEEIGDAVAVYVTSRTILEDETIRLIGQQFLRLVEECSHHNILLNLRNVRAMSTAMIQKIISFSQKVQAAGGRLVLCNVHHSVAPMFQQFKLARSLIIRNDEQDALQALRK